MIKQVTIRDVKDKSVLLYKDNEKIGEISSELSFNDIRLQIKEQKLKGYYVLFDDKKIRIDLNGDLEKWPEGLFDTNEKQIMQLMEYYD